MSATKYSSISTVCDFVTSGNHRYFYMTLPLRHAPQNVIYIHHHFKMYCSVLFNVLTEKDIYYRIIIF